MIPVRGLGGPPGQLPVAYGAEQGDTGKDRCCGMRKPALAALSVRNGQPPHQREPGGYIRETCLITSAGSPGPGFARLRGADTELEEQSMPTVSVLMPV